MKVTRTEQGFTIELDDREGRILCSDLCDVDPYRSEDRKLLQDLIHALERNGIASCELASQVILDRVTEIQRDGYLDPEDWQDLRSVAGFVRRGQLDAAKRLTRNLDTIVRDEIPEIAFPHTGLRRLR